MDINFDNSIANISAGGIKAPGFAKNFQMNGINISDYGNINKFDNVNMLEGHVQVNMPSSLDSIADKELLSDINTLMNAQDKSQSISGVEVSSPDKLYDSFSKALENGVKNLNETQMDSKRKVETFASGGNIDVHTVMIAAEKANLNMQLALQLRNKLVMAYKEVSKLQI